MGRYYHATDENGIQGIIRDGKIKCNNYGQIFLCDTADDSVKFLLLRMVSPIYVLEVFVSNNDVEESFDHNKDFFKCKAYTTNKDIPKSCITNVFVYKSDKKKEMVNNE